VTLSIDSLDYGLVCVAAQSCDIYVFIRTDTLTDFSLVVSRLRDFNDDKPAPNPGYLPQGVPQSAFEQFLASKEAYIQEH
jgi:hypothetical protein